MGVEIRHWVWFEKKIISLGNGGAQEERTNKSLQREKVATRHKYICTYKAVLMRAKLIWHSVAVASQKQQSSLQKARLIVYGVSSCIICETNNSDGETFKSRECAGDGRVWIPWMSEPIDKLWAISWAAIVFVRWGGCSPEIAALNRFCQLRERARMKAWEEAGRQHRRLWSFCKSSVLIIPFFFFF